MIMTNDHVRLVEVGARDGLQNEKRTLPPQTTVQLLEMLADAGLRTLEAGAFVSPRWVPQMSGSDQVLKALTTRPGVTWTALVPNVKGLEAAIEAGCREVAVFTAASEAFSQRNTNCSIAQSLLRYQEVMARARCRSQGQRLRLVRHGLSLHRPRQTRGGRRSQRFALRNGVL